MSRNGANLKEIIDAINRLRADGASEELIKRFSDMCFQSYASQNRLLDYEKLLQKQTLPTRNGAKAANAQVNIESKGVGSYYNSHLKEPRGTGSWSFIDPNGSILTAPGQMTLQAAKSWLKKNATINGYYKVAP